MRSSLLFALHFTNSFCVDDQRLLCGSNASRRLESSTFGFVFLAKVLAGFVGVLFAVSDDNVGFVHLSGGLHEGRVRVGEVFDARLGVPARQLALRQYQISTVTPSLWQRNRILQETNKTSQSELMATAEDLVM